ncbi:MAG TPA: hypothetical protein VEC11_13705 [Allosphingosinicella sp.]|nr:hypothetical protein [Allosphingosinicella sp.]
MAKVKIPKRVAGVKVPKKVRKQAKKALKLTESAAVRELALAGLTLAAQSVVEKAKRAEARPGAGAGDDAKAKPDALDLGLVIHAAVAEGARRFLEGFEEGAAAAAPKPVRTRAKRTANP